MAVKLLKVAVVPVPVIVAPPGLAVTVQLPDAGKPLRATLPVAVLHVGWVIVPTVGAEGIGLMVIVWVPKQFEGDGSLYLITTLVALATLAGGV